MLNPLKQDHQQLNSLIKEEVDQLRSPSLKLGIEERIEDLSRDIIQVSHGILKREWVLVKWGE